jgi:hypothetical protein
MQNLGFALAGLGMLDDALRTERDAVKQAVDRGNKRLEGLCRHYSAKILSMKGLLAEAEEEARAAATLLQVAPPQRAYVLATLGAIVLAQGRPDEGRALVLEASQLLEQLGGIEEGEAAVRLAHAEKAYATGDYATAQRSIAVAAERLQQRAARITDPHWRESFLTQVAENARTIALHRAWNAAG